MRQFRVDNSCLEPLHAAVDPFHHVIAFATVTCKSCHPVGESIIIAYNASGIAIRAQVFAGVKGKGRRIAKGAYKLSLVLGEMCLGAIFYDPQIVLSCNSHHRAHVRRLSIEMNWNDSDRGG